MKRMGGVPMDIPLLMPTLPLPPRLRDGANKEILGIIVSYKVKVKLVVSRGG